MGQSCLTVRTTDQSKARQLGGGTGIFSTHKLTARTACVTCPGNLVALRPPLVCLISSLVNTRIIALARVQIWNVRCTVVSVCSIWIFGILPQTNTHSSCHGSYYVHPCWSSEIIDHVVLSYIVSINHSYRHPWACVHTRKTHRHTAHKKHMSNIHIKQSSQNNEKSSVEAAPSTMTTKEAIPIPPDKIQTTCDHLAVTEDRLTTDETPHLG